MKEIFTEVYKNKKWLKGSGVGSKPKFNEEYIAFLGTFLKDNKIKSVIDFGCGDWQFSQFVDWGDTEYLGLDIVDSVIENNKKQFPEYSFVSDTDIFKYITPDKDLVIIKDVFMHWTDVEIVSFLQKLIAYDIKILSINESGQKKYRRLKTGGFSRLDYDKYPLKWFYGKLIFKWQNRQVLLINNKDE